MLKHCAFLFLIVFAGFSCRPDEELNNDKKLNMESSLGCLDSIALTLNYLPYLTTVDKLKQAITIDEFHEFEIYMPDGVTPASGIIENDYLLATERISDGAPQVYTLQKQNLQSEVIVDGAYTELLSYSLCGDAWNSKHTSRTYYFNAQKDSTYTIYLFSGDSAGGYPFATVSDSTGHLYLLDVPSGTTAGTGCWGDPCSESEVYTIQSNVDGKIYFEFYSFNGPNYTYNLIGLIRVWVKK